MPAERMAMRHVREVLRLKFVGGVPTREIARRIGVAASTVRATIKRFQAAGLSWPLPEELTDAALEARLFADTGATQGRRRQVEPEWVSIHRELKRKHVTLSLLWDEYIARNPQGYCYSRFCELYRIWEAKLSVTMRQTHVGGEKLFVDYAGDTVPVIVDRLTGEVRQAQIFVAVMGASNFTYVEATWTQALASPSSRASTASVVLFLDPLGFPAGLTLWPGLNVVAVTCSVLYLQADLRPGGL
jgi:transposase-like protein